MNRYLANGVVASMLATAGMAHATEYNLTITDIGGQPLSPLFFATSNGSYDLFTPGQAASLGIKHIAEMGATGDLVAEAMAAGNQLAQYGVLGHSPFGTGQSGSTMFFADGSHPYLNFAAMLGKTNDGFIGDSVSSGGIDLFSNAYKNGFTLYILGSDAWDAGTELNTQNAADLGFLGGTGNPAEDPTMAFVHPHPGIIPGVGDSWQLMPSWQPGDVLATVNVTPTPGPASAIPFALGSLMAWRRRRAKAK